MEIPKKSRCALLVEPNKPLVIGELPIPEVEPGAILVKTVLASLCGSDIGLWHGDPPAPRPRIMGHEMVGKVVKLGAGVTTDWFGDKLQIGDRIVFSHAPCRKCYFCNVLHLPNMCPNRVSYATNSHCELPPYLLGTCSEYVYVLPTAGIKKVPDEVNDLEASPATCAFRTVIKSYERLGQIGTDDIILIQGAGNLGLYSAAVAQESNAKKVIVLDISNERLEQAKKFGADVTLNTKDFTEVEVKKRIMELTGGRGPDIVMEYTGVPSVFKQGIDLIRKGGRYVLTGHITGIIEMDPWTIVAKEINIKGNYSADIPQYHKALEFIKNHKDKYPFKELITNTYKLEDINKALTAMVAGKERKPAIVFD